MQAFGLQHRILSHTHSPMTERHRLSQSFWSESSNAAAWLPYILSAKQLPRLLYIEKFHNAHQYMRYHIMPLQSETLCMT